MTSKPFSESSLSVITPVYHNEKTLEKLCELVFEAAQDKFKTIEYIFVNDDFPDESRSVLLRMAKSNPRVKVITLARNFGQHTALMVGLHHCSGDYVMMLDADLADSPAHLGSMLEKLSHGFEIVIARRKNPRRSLFRSVGSKLYTFVFNFLSDYKMIEDATTLRVMTRRYVSYLLKFPERPFLAGFTAWIGMPCATIDVPWEDQPNSSGYTLRKLLNHARVGLIGFSNKPIRFAFHIGFVITCGSLALASYLVLRKIFYGDVLKGYTSAVALFTFLMGIQFIFIGLLGEYIGEIFLTVKRRPDHLIYDKVNF